MSEQPRGTCARMGIPHTKGPDCIEWIAAPSQPASPAGCNCAWCQPREPQTEAAPPADGLRTIKQFAGLCGICGHNTRMTVDVTDLLADERKRVLWLQELLIQRQQTIHALLHDKTTGIDQCGHTDCSALVTKMMEEGAWPERSKLGGRNV